MIGIIQTSRKPLFSLPKTLISSFRQQFALQTNKILPKFPPVSPTNTFSTSTLQHKSPFESNLIRMVTSEIEYDSEDTPPYQPDKRFNAFMVEGRPGEQFVTLRGIDENIKIEATMVDGVLPTMDDSDNPQLHISLLVDILKGGEEGEMLEFVCSAWPERLEIQKLYVLKVGGTLSRPYTGPHFRVLDKKIQSSIYEYLNARGVNNELCSFLHRYVWNKDKIEHIQCLKLLKSYLET